MSEDTREMVAFLAAVVVPLLVVLYIGFGVTAGWRGILGVTLSALGAAALIGWVHLVLWWQERCR